MWKGCGKLESWVVDTVMRDGAAKFCKLLQVGLNPRADLTADLSLDLNSLAVVK